MKILLLNNSHLPMIGGKEIVVHHLARQYKKLGHEVVLAGPSGMLKQRSHDFGYRVDRYPSLPLLDENSQWRIRALVILLRQRFDIVHAHTTHPCAYAAAKSMQLLRLTTPIVVTPHGADIHKVPELNFGKRLSPTLDKRINWALHQCAYATSISESIKSSLLDAGCPEEVIVDIPNGVDADRFESPSKLNAREELSIPNNTRLLVTTGNYHPRKGHEVLIDALQKLNDPTVHVAIVGRTKEEFVQKVKGSSVAQQVSFLGVIPFPLNDTPDKPDLLVALLQQADAYISASRDEGTEGLSLAVLEAMSANCCPIVTDVSGNRDVVHDGVSGRLVPPNDAEALARAINETLADNNKRMAMREEAKRSIETLTWTAVAQQYLATYQSAINSAAPTPAQARS